MGPRLSRKRKHSQMEENWERTEAKACFDNDRISDLPPEILDKILVKLAIREAIRTSVLSREWRDQWKSLSHLKFFNYSHMPVSDNTMFLKKFLENHERKQLDKLSLYYCLAGINIFPDLWIKIVSSKVIKDVKILEYQPSVLPTPFFSLRQLVNLQIIGCEIILPDSFQGFKLLRSLRLRRVIISDTHFKTLIFTCSNLETLTLERFIRRNSLENKKLVVNSPSLKNLEMVYHMHEWVSFENCPRITSIAIMSKLCWGEYSYFNYWESADFPNWPYNDLLLDNRIPNHAVIDQANKEVAINLLKAVASCSALERLSLPAKLFELLEKNDLKIADTPKLLNLKTFHFTQLDYKNLNLFRGLLLILLRSPNLERFDFSIVDSGSCEFFEKILREGLKLRTSPFNKLRFVKMKFMYAYEVASVLELLKLIVGFSPVLEKVTLRKEGDRKGKLPEKCLKEEVKKLKQVVRSPNVMFRYEFKGPPRFSSAL